MTEPVSILSVNHLTKIFGGRGLFAKTAIKAVDDVSFEFSQDPIIIALTGESGSGKTTIGRLILRQLQLSSGNIYYKMKDIRNLSKSENRSYTKNIQSIFQDPYSAYNPFYKIKRSLQTPIKKFGFASEDADSIIAETLQNVGLEEEIIDKHPHEMSGGQLQRVMLARLLIIKPEIIVADEPISMLDASLSANVLNLILKMNKEQRISFLYITHDLSSAEYISDEILVLYRGMIVEKGDVNLVLSDPVHPYTQLLLSSIPATDPEKRWKKKIDLKAAETIHYLKTGKGCKFYSRCPNATEKCEKLMPQMVEVGSNHETRCFLYGE